MEIELEEIGNVQVNSFLNIQACIFGAPASPLLSLETLETPTSSFWPPLSSSSVSAKPQLRVMWSSGVKVCKSAKEGIIEGRIMHKRTRNMPTKVASYWARSMKLIEVCK